LVAETTMIMDPSNDAPNGTIALGTMTKKNKHSSRRFHWRNQPQFSLPVWWKATKM